MTGRDEARQHRGKVPLSERLKDGGAVAVLILAAVWVLFPFYWAAITSLKQPVDVFRLSFVPWLQFKPTLANWQSELFYRGSAIFGGLGNSFFIGLGACFVAMALGTLAGYGLARFRYSGWRNRDISLYFLSQRFLPPAATILPFFYFAQRLHLLDTRIILIAANATFTMPFAVLLMRDAFQGIPIEMEEAARVDGASALQVLLHISLPLAAPTLVAAGIISFAFTWNEFLFAFVLSYSRAVPMSVVIAGTQDVMGVQFWYVSTRLLLAILPPAIVVLIVQRYIVTGLTLGAVKG
jgi:multiple sugar transport system permease protein